ncbi:protein-L-isoaspartate O-methyltransferase [Nocardiopsis sp. CNT312]|uniref:protein-L-isoaspartate O-methyltransferase n=1 Tax=Nocardiopsis sp. CNT312 TaxID=1137268 RepID=UPI0004914818|nr:protein-L-isoaspartate O-methyltransferase [Nocardiopsis sp. CNT312]
MLPPHEKLISRLEQAGDLRPRWRPAFERVERHRFLTDRITAPNGTVVDRRTDEGRWLALAYSDEDLLVRPDGGPADPASSPSTVARMLAHLDVSPGMRVLSVGSDTGYGSALLAHRLGDEQVITVEADPVRAEQARVNLIGTGFTPLVVTGDGLQGWPARGPYDRVISTVSVQRVPYHWVAQTEPCGRILTPWGTSYRDGVLADLRVGPSGTASGRFISGPFCRPWPEVTAPAAQDHPRFPGSGGFSVTRTDLRPNEPVDDFDASFAIGLHLPGVTVRVLPDDGPGFTVHLADPRTSSRASWRVDPERDSGGHEVRQYGPRELFTELEAAYRWWTEAGRPAHTRFGLTVSSELQLVWLDEESRLVASTT